MRLVRVFDRSLVTVLLVIPMFAGGCGSSAPTAPAVDGQVHSSVDELKQRLAQVAKNGDGGSSLMGLSESVEKLRPTLGDKTDKLAKGVSQLDSAGTPEQRKTIAARMLKEL